MAEAQQIFISDVHYQNFRNLEDLYLAPDEQLTILVGPNAAGKSNCLEGLQLVAGGTTFRHAAAQELIQDGYEKAVLLAHMTTEKRKLDISYTFSQNSKKLTINTKPRPLHEGSALLPTVVFCPDDLLIIKGAPSERRALFDTFGVQAAASYGAVLSDFRQALSQRNMLLKEARQNNTAIDADLLDAWTDSFISVGSELFLYRTSLVRRLTPHIQRRYAELSDHEELEIAYQTSYGRQDGRLLCERDEVKTALANSLMDRAADEQRRGQTLVGPHYDDVLFTIAGKSARDFGSQGQQRTLILAVKLAQVDLIHELKQFYPLFLLDDVMSELDKQHRANLIESIQKGMQTVITTTNLDYFTAGELDRAKVVTLDERS